MRAPRFQHIIAWLLLALLVAPLVACGADNDSASEPAPASSAPAPPAPTATQRASTQGPGPSATSSGDDELPAQVALALRAAADDAGVPPEQVELVEWTSTEWNDSALGCPQPGMFYAQVITPGYIVTVRVNGTQLDYHTDTTNRVVTC